MDLVWSNAEMVQKLNDIAAYEGEPHGSNPGSDPEGALVQPRGTFFSTASPRRNRPSPVRERHTLLIKGKAPIFSLEKQVAA
jgi:hypothetical protein